MGNRIIRGAVMLLAALCGVARADVDMSGSWFVNLQLGPFGEFPCRAEFHQTGTTLGFNADCFPIESGTGTVDPATGAFTITLSEAIGFCPGAVMTGLAALDGRTFEADVTCFVDLHLSGSRCGNGALDDGEQCDDGNRADGDCCSAACAAVPEGTVCDAGNPCAQSACDGTGTCVGSPVSGPCDDGNPCTGGDTCVDGACRTEPLADGTTCDDGDPCSETSACYATYCFAETPVRCGACETCDPSDGACVPGLESYCGPIFQGASLRVRDDVVDRRDRLQFRLEEAAVNAGQFGDPRTTTSWDVCVFQNGGAGAPLAELSVPAGGSCDGRACWRPTPHGYRYRDASAAQDGVKSLTLDSGPRSNIDLRAGGLGLALGTLPAILPLVVQVKGSDTQCWQATYFDTEVNGPIELRARALGYFE